MGTTMKKLLLALMFAACLTSTPRALSILTPACSTSMFNRECGVDIASTMTALSDMYRQLVVRIVPPNIINFAPTSGAEATSVVITGTGFLSTQGNSVVKFNGTTATPSAWSATSITVPVPTGATTGPVTVTVGGRTSSLGTFTVSSSANPMAASRMPSASTTLPDAVWATAGVEGGIPATRTRCGSVIAAYGTVGTPLSASTINNAISACGSNKIVELGAGDFYLSNGISFDNIQFVTLRGQGASSTFLHFSNDTNCAGLFAGICSGISAGGGYYADTSPTNPAHTTTWTAGYTQGATSITVGATTGLSVGMWIVLDQLNDASDTGDVFVCQSGTVGTGCTDEGGATNQRPSRAQREWHKVTNIAGTTLTISPGLMMPNWRSGQTPGAWWGNLGGLIEGDGIENLSMDAPPGDRCIVLEYALNSWVSGVRCMNPEGNNDFSNFGAVLIYGGVHNTIRDSYIWGNQGVWESGTYGFTTYGSGYNLIENNLVANRPGAFFINGDLGTVIAYNHARDSRYDKSAGFLQVSNYMHEGGSAMDLNEGNDSTGAKNDIVHSSSNLFIHLRNRYVGWETGMTTETQAVKMYAYNRYMTFLGNVVGENTYHTNYESGNALSIWAFGTAGATARTPTDSISSTTAMRWGNYDTVNDAVRWVSGEVPSGISVLPNPVPGVQTVPISMYLTAAPSYFTFTSTPWPSIGPDITCVSNCPTGLGNRVIKIPSRQCYESLSNDTNYADPGSGHERAKIFNASSCYGR